MSQKIAYQPGHGWTKMEENIRGGWSGGNGKNPAPHWNDMSVFSAPLGRNPIEGDVIDWSFSHPDWTIKALAILGLTCRKGEVKNVYQAIRNSLGGYDIVKNYNNQGDIVYTGTWEERENQIAIVANCVSETHCPPI
jgi:hypothetical protein